MKKETHRVSLYALVGVPTPRTIQVEGVIKQTMLQVLVDLGANLNFIHGRWAQRLELPIDKSASFEVLVRSGNTMERRGVCRKVPLQLGESSFFMDFHVVPFHGSDAILGVAWLEQLGQVLFDYQRRSLSFRVGATSRTITDLPSTAREISTSELP